MTGTLTLLVLLHVLGATLATPDPPEGFEHNIWMDPQEKYRLYWTFDDEKITFEVQVETLGWVGFGLSPKGKMEGGDMVMGVVHQDGVAEIVDVHARVQGSVINDTLQNWALVSSARTDTHTVLRVTRFLVTCDTEGDMPIGDETIRLIYGYSSTDSPTFSYHGRTHNRHGGSTRGTKSVQLLKVMPSAGNIPSDAVAYDFDMQNHIIPGVRTSYFCQILAPPTLNRPWQRHHVVAFSTHLTPGNEGIVHHMTLWGCFDNPQSRIGRRIGDQWNCYNQATNMPGMECTSAVFGWAIGAEIFFFPENTGFPIGGRRMPSYMFLEIHYDNPALELNRYDSSGIRLWITPTPRQYDTGVLQIGAAIGPDYQIVPPYQESWTSEGHCSPNCLAEAMGGVRDLNIYAHLLHTHGTGRTVSVHHYSNRQEQPIIADDDHYDYNFQEIRLMKSERKLQKGDSLMVHCTYDTRDNRTVIQGGMTTENEMCYAYLLYYPAIDLTFCLSSPTAQQTLGGIRNMGEVRALIPTALPPSLPAGGALAEGRAGPPGTVTYTHAMLGHPLDEFYNIVSGSYTGWRLEDVMRYQDWRQDAVRSQFQTAVLTGKMLGFCVHDGRNFQSDNEVIDVPAVSTRYTAASPQCRAGVPQTPTPAPPTPAPACRDSPQWAQYCPLWSSWCGNHTGVQSVCRGSCNLCQVCEDLDPQCPSVARFPEMCLFDMTKRLCPVSCNFCNHQDCQDDEMFGPQCRNLVGSCGVAKVAALCPRTCRRGCGARN